MPAKAPKRLALADVPRVPNVQADGVYRESAESRAAIAKRQLLAWMEAVSVCGPGATAYGRWRLKDRSGAKPDVLVSCCQRPGQGGWLPRYEDLVPDHNERLGPPFIAYPRPRWEPPGPAGFGFRWMVCFESIELYQPATADELKAAAERRRAKGAEKAAAVEAENARKLAELEEWTRRNVTPDLFPEES